MKTFAAFLIAVHSFHSFAAATVTRLPNKTLELVESCAQIQARGNELVQWTQATEKRACKIGASRPKLKACAIDISDCVPAHVKRYQGANPRVDGPNCFNLALVMAGVLPELRNTGGMEWDFYMQNFCHPIPAGSKPQVGDVGTVLETFEDGSTPLFHHGFIYISPSLVYSKNGEGKSEPYALQSLAPMAKTYGVTGYGGKCITDEGCPRGDLRYYRCETFDQYFARAQTQRRSELSQTVKHISQLECLNQKAMFDHSGYAEPLKGLIEDSLQTMVSYLQQNAQGWPSSTPDEKKLLRSLALRVESVQTAYRSDGGRDTGLSSLFSKARMELESH